LRAFAPDETAVWDELVDTSVNGTLLHTRRFLTYHGPRFIEKSVVIRDERDRIVGLLPAAEDPHDSATVISHPGVTYGGLVHNGDLRGEGQVHALTLITTHFWELGYTRFVYKAVPFIYHRRAASDDLYALFRIGATRTRCELLAALDLAAPGRVRSGRRYGLKRAAHAGIEVYVGWEATEAFWRLLQDLLRDRYGSMPTHSLDEIDELHRRCPKEIELVVAKCGEEVVAGTVLFEAGAAVHLQYSAATERGRRASAMDAVLARGIELSRSRQCRYFSFGTSSEGYRVNQSLYEFKLSFGAGSVTQDQYEVRLPVERRESMGD
jgi:hypothetical protein